MFLKNSIAIPVAYLRYDFINMLLVCLLLFLLQLLPRPQQ